MAGGAVDLDRADGTHLATALTADGSNPSTGQAPGGYSVSFRKPAGAEDDHTFSPQDQGPDDTADRDVGGLGFFNTFALLADEDEDDLDASLIPDIV
jgi:SdrD B-like domain